MRLYLDACAIVYSIEGVNGHRETRISNQIK